MNDTVLLNNVTQLGDSFHKFLFQYNISKYVKITQLICLVTQLEY
jgi:hypothetical protein